jgi:MFS family permease
MLRRRTYYVALLIWSFIYIAGTLLAPLAPNRFNITPAKTHLLQVSFALPIVLIWAAAVYGAERFKSYALSIKNDKDGRALNKIASGLVLLVVSVMFSGLSGILRPWALRDGWLQQFTIAFGYLQVLLPLAAFYIMYRGSQKLKKALPTKATMSSWLYVLLIMVPVAVLYLAVVFNYAYRNSTPDASKYSSFYLPDYLILLTLIAPYLAGWALGLKAALNIAAYRKRVNGVIYRAALSRLVVGVMTIITFAVLLQLLISLSAYLSHAGLGAILLVVYLIVLTYSIGFLILASGAQKLNAIEKVKVN